MYVARSSASTLAGRVERWTVAAGPAPEPADAVAAGDHERPLWRVESRYAEETWLASEAERGFMPELMWLSFLLVQEASAGAP
jgi:hypothetical protein